MRASRSAGEGIERSAMEEPYRREVAAAPVRAGPGMASGRLAGSADGPRPSGAQAVPDPVRGQAAVGAVNSASMEILTSSETSTPPVSRAAFQVRPNSLREIVVWPVKPAR